mmetsp:Transcript_69670/g.207583  ORF Transcript_69670/g.207583 Transcript_69670/m.207583 type:complete len:246 (-) Transcript_69670:632-1369(-)
MLPDVDAPLLDLHLVQGALAVALLLLAQAPPDLPGDVLAQGRGDAFRLHLPEEILAGLQGHLLLQHCLPVLQEGVLAVVQARPARGPLLVRDLLAGALEPLHEPRGVEGGGGRLEGDRFGARGAAEALWRGPGHRRRPHGLRGRGAERAQGHVGSKSSLRPRLRVPRGRGGEGPRMRAALRRREPGLNLRHAQLRAREVGQRGRRGLGDGALAGALVPGAAQVEGHVDEAVLHGSLLAAHVEEGA